MFKTGRFGKVVAIAFAIFVAANVRNVAMAESPVEKGAPGPANVRLNDQTERFTKEAKEADQIKPKARQLNKKERHISQGSPGATRPSGIEATKHQPKTPDQLENGVSTQGGK
jgi:hypothetical protein